MYFVSKVFNGNSDRNTPVTSMFPVPVLTTFVRIKVIEYEVLAAARFEVLGCDGK